MSLRSKVALIMAVAVLLMVGLNAAVLVPVSRSFASLERAEAQRNSARIEQAIAAELQHMARNALDWSNWDEAYEFAMGRNPSFIEENLYFETLKNLDVQFMAVYDRAGNIAWGEAYDLGSGTRIHLQQFAPGALGPDSPLLAKTEPQSVTTGIMATDAGPMLVASSPIVRVGEAVPAAGTFVFGRLLDATLIDRIRRQANVHVEVEPVTAAGEGMPGHAAEAGITIEERSPDMLVGHTTLTDLHGEPVIHLDSLTPRDVSRIGNRSIGLSLLSLALAGVADLMIMWILLRRLVLRPVTRITRHILEIGRTGALDRRVPALAGDELGVLAREFNAMLDRLTEANKQLVDQSHRTGMAEMASGVLHNLRNGLGPLVGRLDIVSDAMRNAPGGELRRAIEEFRDPGTDPARKDRLLDYVTATGDSFATLRETTLAELGRAKTLAGRLGEILSHQDKFIYSSSRVEPLAIGDVVRDAMSLLPPGLAATVEIRIDDAVDRLPPVAAERIALMQIVHNLLLNAAEAIQVAGREDGRIDITAAPVGTASDLLDLQFRDNGAGIEHANLARVFERGFTTKTARAGGLGLHWCANSVIGMRGRLRAESAGPGSGATFHLQLPISRHAMAAA